VDEIVRRLQGPLKKIALERLRSLSMWMGVARRQRMTETERYRAMPMTNESKTQEPKEAEPGEVIEFYVPLNFVRPVRRIPAWHRGELLQFVPRQKKTA
jgi:hypothetical protein